MKILYILNESPYYNQIILHSLLSVRIHNPKIQIEILYVHDKQKDSRFKTNDLLNFNEFYSTCKKLNVSLISINDLDMGEEAGFHPVQRQAFAQVPDNDNILLLDSDTFIFGDVKNFEHNLKHHEMIMDLTTWSKNRRKLFLDNESLPIYNSGVVLSKAGLLQEYGKQVYGLCMELKSDTTLNGMEYKKIEDAERTKDKLGREEIAFNLFVKRHKISHRPAKNYEIQTEHLTCNTLILHTMFQNYQKFYKRFVKKGRFIPPFKLPRKIFLY